MSREMYDSFGADSLLRRVLVVCGPDVYKEKQDLIKAGPGFPERMNKFYDWCYENQIIPL